MAAVAPAGWALALILSQLWVQWNNAQKAANAKFVAQMTKNGEREMKNATVLLGHGSTFIAPT